MIDSDDMRSLQQMAKYGAGRGGRGGALAQVRAIPYIDMTDHLYTACLVCPGGSHYGSRRQCGRLVSFLSVESLLTGEIFPKMVTR